MDAQVIQRGEAIRQMKLLTKQGVPFSFSFFSYDETRGISRGEIKVPAALIRSKSQTNSVLLEYVDVVQQQNKKCYECLLMTFEGKNIYI
ncbi:hypothetical protein AXE80_10855 [Wenyingzhuangia fucanilytica]|uniref:Uncharacterized protein n=1 Tax=Wenyingzhuangia fucanilytica TaxID=1790137 RepID=A0A1B1Y7J1_9FLAO|nr:hypothetical protein [Wenyingzhuangia fucanilytica]ANW96743.1 hypothetical protein AXE80_10855 [Wenyingzhuangia fucanilytica]